MWKDPPLCQHYGEHLRHSYFAWLCPRCIPATNHGDTVAEWKLLTPDCAVLSDSLAYLDPEIHWLGYRGIESRVSRVKYQRVCQVMFWDVH